MSFSGRRAAAVRSHLQPRLPRLAGHLRHRQRGVQRFRRLPADETLEAVSFFTAADDVTYTVTVYDRFEGGAAPRPAVFDDRRHPDHGLPHRRPPEPVALAAGDDFFVELELSAGGQPYDRTSDVPVLLGARYRTIVPSSAAAGESFYWDGGGWVDLQDYDDPPWTGTANFCIKALGVDAGFRVSPPGTLRSEGPVGGPFMPQSFDYACRYRGVEPAHYDIVVVPAVSWLALAGPTSGVLADGETVVVTAIITDTAARSGCGRIHLRCRVPQPRRRRRQHESSHRARRRRPPAAVRLESRYGSRLDR